MPTTTSKIHKNELATRFQQSYTRREAPISFQKNIALMNKLGVTRSAVHKKGVDELYADLIKYKHEPVLNYDLERIIY